MSSLAPMGNSKSQKTTISDFCENSLSQLQTVITRELPGLFQQYIYHSPADLKLLYESNLYYLCSSPLKELLLTIKNDIPTFPGRDCQESNVNLNGRPQLNIFNRTLSRG